MNENEFPTIRDLHDCLCMLIERGLGDLPVQIVITPDSTIQALAEEEGQKTSKPTLMVEYPRDGKQLGVSFISTDRFSRGGMPSRESH